MNLNRRGVVQRRAVGHLCGDRDTRHIEFGIGFGQVPAGIPFRRIGLADPRRAETQADVAVPPAVIAEFGEPPVGLA